MGMLHGYEINQAPRGGFVVSKSFEIGEGTPVVAAFSNAPDLITWLATEYGVSIAIGVESPESEGRVILSPTLGGPLSYDDAVAGWIEHDGKSMPKSERGKPCMVRRRDGTQYATSTFLNRDDWDWRYPNGGNDCPSDIVAYRLIADTDWSFARQIAEHAAKIG